MEAGLDGRQDERIIRAAESVIDEAVEFYSNVVGLVQTGRDATRAYFKGWDERDHHSLILRDAGEAGMDFYGFKVADDATLATLEADLKNYGVTTERIPAGDLLETGERVRFQIPSGHLIELYSQKTDVGNGMGYINPPPWNEAPAPMRSGTVAAVRITIGPPMQ